MPPHEPPQQQLQFRTASSSMGGSEFSVNTIGADFCQGIPKAELHLHIEGTLEPEHMFALAQRNGVALPYPDIEAVRAAYQFSNLQEFLDLYYKGAAVLLHECDFEELMFNYLIRAKADGVVRAEVFFDPQTHTHRGVGFAVFMKGFTKAIKRAEKELGISVALIMCFLRHLPPEDALKTWHESQPYVKDGTILGVGLDSSEKNYPPALFTEVFGLAAKAGLKLVAHAGEEGPPEYIVSSLKDLGVHRIDHGVRCEEDEALLDELVKSQIALTVCPFSNLELKVIDKLEDANLKRLLDRGIAITINSDDPAYFHGYIAENYRATAEALGMTQEDVIKVARTSLEASFAPEEQKKMWLDQLDAFVRESNKAEMEAPNTTTLLTAQVS